MHPSADSFYHGYILRFFWQYGWELCLDVMLVGATRGVMLAVDRMSPKNGGNGGRIVNTASMAGLSVIDETNITKPPIDHFIHSNWCWLRAFSVIYVHLAADTTISIFCLLFKQTQLTFSFKSKGGLILSFYPIYSLNQFA